MVFALVGGIYCNAATNDTVSLTVGQLSEMVLSGDGLLGLSRLGSDVKAELNKAIRSGWQAKATRPDRPLVALINLGDTNAMHHAMEIRAQSAVFGVRILGKTLRENCDQAQFLTFLASELSIDEPSSIQRVHGDVVVEQRSVDAAKIMRLIIMRSGAFSTQVREWADGLNTRDREQIRLTMREWWKDNAVHVIQGTYQRATPGPRSLTGID